MRRRKYLKGLRLAARKAGSKALLAQRLGIAGQSIDKWQYIPMRRVMQIERETGVRRELLAPDIFK